MTTTSLVEGGARRIPATFNNNFFACSAQVLTGKASGSTKIGIRSEMNDNMPIEILSAETGPASCKIQQVNVFGNWHKWRRWFGSPWGCFRFSIPCGSLWNSTAAAFKSRTFSACDTLIDITGSGTAPGVGG